MRWTESSIYAAPVSRVSPTLMPLGRETPAFWDAERYLWFTRPALCTIILRLANISRTLGQSEDRAGRSSCNTRLHQTDQSSMPPPSRASTRLLTSSFLASCIESYLDSSSRVNSKSDFSNAVLFTLKASRAIEPIKIPKAEITETKSDWATISF